MIHQWANTSGRKCFGKYRNWLCNRHISWSAWTENCRLGFPPPSQHLKAFRACLGPPSAYCCKGPHYYCCSTNLHENGGETTPTVKAGTRPRPLLWRSPCLHRRRCLTITNSILCLNSERYQGAMKCNSLAKFPQRPCSILAANVWFGSTRFSTSTNSTESFKGDLAVPKIPF